MPGAILALDPATLTGVADGVPGSDPVLSVVKLRRDEDCTHIDLIRRAADFMWRRMANDRPDLVVIEAAVPPHAVKGHTTARSTEVLQQVRGAYIGIAAAAGVKVVEVHIRTWRKSVLGMGNLPGARAKYLMMQQCKHLGWNAPDHNAAEAAGIWLWACSQRGYDGQQDLSRSINEGFAHIRARQAAGGPGWQRKES